MSHDGLGVVDLNCRDKSLSLNLKLLAADGLEAANQVVEDAGHVRAVVWWTEWSACAESTSRKAARRNAGVGPQESARALQLTERDAVALAVDDQGDELALVRVDGLRKCAAAGSVQWTAPPA